jgi:hypothetical protein
MGKISVKAKAKENASKDVEVNEKGDIKVNLNKPQEEKKEEPEKKVEEKVEEKVDEKVEDKKPEENKIEEEVIEVALEEVIVGEESKEPEATVNKPSEKEIGKASLNLPEGVEKLVKFIEDGLGDINDYVTLNTDYSKLDGDNLLREYYKKSKPHLDSEEIDFLMEDNFDYDEDIDEDRVIKKKKLLKKEETAKAKDYLEGLKSKYYEDIKGSAKLTPEQQKAVDFFSRNKSKEAVSLGERTIFEQKTYSLTNSKVLNIKLEKRITDSRLKIQQRLKPSKATLIILLGSS